MVQGKRVGGSMGMTRIKNNSVEMSSCTFHLAVTCRGIRRSSMFFGHLLSWDAARFWWLHFLLKLSCHSVGKPHVFVLLGLSLFLEVPSFRMTQRGGYQCDEFDLGWNNYLVNGWYTENDLQIYWWLLFCHFLNKNAKFSVVSATQMRTFLSVLS